MLLRLLVVAALGSRNREEGEKKQKEQKQQLEKQQ